MVPWSEAKLFGSERQDHLRSDFAHPAYHNFHIFSPELLNQEISMWRLRLSSRLHRYLGSSARSTWRTCWSQSITPCSSNKVHGSYPHRFFARGSSCRVHSTRKCTLTALAASIPIKVQPLKLNPYPASRCPGSASWRPQDSSVSLSWSWPGRPLGSPYLLASLFEGTVHYYWRHLGLLFV